jgi:hypothetical protein
MNSPADFTVDLNDILYQMNGQCSADCAGCSPMSAFAYDNFGGTLSKAERPFSTK